MALKEKIHKDLTAAVKEKDEFCSSALRLLSAVILNKEKEKRYKISQEKPDFKEEELAEKSQLTDEEVIEVVASEIKKNKEAIIEFEEAMLLLSSRPASRNSAFEKGKIQDLIEKEKKVIEIWQKYLPEQLAEEEIQKLVKEAIGKTGAKEPRDMGKVMAALMPKVKGRADGALVSKIVKEALGK